MRTITIIIHHFLKNDKMLNISLDYLFGSLMAVDSISKYGYSIDFDVFDSSNNKDKLLELFLKMIFLNMIL